MTAGPLRILMVVPSLHRGGAERLVLTLSSQLVARGHDVRIITLHTGNQFPELSAGLAMDTVPARVSYSLTGKDHIDTEAYDQIVTSFRPHIVQSHLFEAELVSMARPHPGTVHITHWHGCHPPTDPIGLIDLLMRDTWWNLNNVRRLRNSYRTQGNHFLCISQFIKSYVSRVFSPADEDMTVIPNPIDLAAFPLNRAPSDGFRMLNIGSMTSLKNQAFLLKVMSELRRRGVNDINLTFLGDGPDRAALEAQTAAEGLTDHVHFAGIVPDPHMWLNRSQVLVHSAPLEPFGLVVLEAKACGVPSIGFRQGGIAEVIRHGEDGYLVPFNDVDSFCNAVIKLKNDPLLWQKMSDAGLSDVEHYALGGYMDRLEALYHRLLAARN
jgi:glycosyltransferase involved in cell wall biosynthesis